MKITMKFTIMPTDWDTSNEQLIKTIRTYQKHKCFSPNDIDELVYECGSFNATMNIAIAKLNSLKQRFPFVCFELYSGDIWGELRYISKA